MEAFVAAVTLVVAVGTIFLGSVQSFQVETWFNDSPEPRGMPEVTGRAACMFPVLGSASLLLLFFAFQMLSDFLVLYLAVSSYAAVYACATGFLERSSLSTGVQAGSSTILALGLVVAWICTNHFLFIDGIGFCLCVTMISLLRLNSLRVGAIAGIMLFVYDTFWVFFSHLIFQENVMVKVATQQATNPVYNMAAAAHLPGADNLAESLELPIKFLFPVYTQEGVRYSLLGLGDVAIPGIFVCFCMRVDHYVNSKVHNVQEELRDLESATSLLPRDESVQAAPGSQWSFRRYPYFTAALAGYAVGLLLAMLCVRIFNMAQPALFYIVPCSLLPVLALGCAKGQLRLLWKGLNADDVHRH